MPRIQLSWLLLGAAAALRPQVTRRSLGGAASTLVLAPQSSRAAEGPTEALLPEAIYAGNDWIADRKLTIIEGDAAAAETAWRALGGAGRPAVLPAHPEDGRHRDRGRGVDRRARARPVRPAL